LLEVIGKDTWSSPERLAALSALRLSPSALAIVTEDDVRLFSRTLRSQQKDIRIAACHLLAELGSFELARSELVAYAKNSRHREFRESLRCLARLGANDPTVLEFASELLRDRLTSALSGVFGGELDQAEFGRVLRFCEDVGVRVPDQSAMALRRLAEDYRAPKAVRIHAIRAFGRVARAGAATLSVLLDWLARDTPPFESSVGAAVEQYVLGLRFSLDGVKTVYDRLSELESAIVARWNRVGPSRSRYIDDYGLRGLRRALAEVIGIRASYAELSPPVLPPPQAPV
jgi:hypothetical protein